MSISERNKDAGQPARPDSDAAGAGKHGESGVSEGDAGFFGGGRLVGGTGDGSQGRTGTTGTTHQPPTKEKDREKDEGEPIASALADGDRTAGAGSDMSSGPGTLGATSGGERAATGRSDANRSSKDHGNALED